ncbi:MAG TPA: Hpt domain-containing protein, partial [Candidatus Polarisedimenticolia bacterium]|nr:Hpt domain-containing protein [Candidatus Polarisedimenticolia bacterium]
MRKYLDLFVAEAGEHIQGAVQQLARLGAGAPPETIHSLFRHFHSIKGMAASMGFEEIGALSHAVEDLFDLLRKGSGPPLESVPDVVMETLDAMTAMVAEAAAVGPGARLSYDPQPLIARVRVLAPAAERSPAAARPSPPAP